MMHSKNMIFTSAVCMFTFVRDTFLHLRSAKTQGMHVVASAAGLLHDGDVSATEHTGKRRQRGSAPCTLLFDLNIWKLENISQVVVNGN